MTVIDPVIVTMNDATLLIGADNYETSISSCQIVPTVTTSTFKGIGGNIINTAGTPTWVANIGYAQDWATAGSLSNYLLANAGTAVAATFAPKDGGPAYDVTLVIAPGPMGGDSDAQLVATVSLTVNGQPTLHDAG